MIRTILIAGAAALALATPARADDAAAGEFLATITYAKNNCLEYEFVRPMVIEVFHRLVRNIVDGNPMPPAMAAAAEAAYVKLGVDDPRDVCARIWNEFGADGTSFPGAFARK